jgi:hypothetical protein
LKMGFSVLERRFLNPPGWVCALLAPEFIRAA